MTGFSCVNWSGAVPRVIVPRRYNAAVDFVDRNVREGRGDKIAVIDDRGSYTYGQVLERVNRAGNMIRGLGVAPEQRVLLCLSDGIDFPTCFYGAIKSGAVPIPVNTLLRGPDYDFMLRDSRAPALIVGAEHYNKFAPILDDQPFLRHVIVAGGEAGDHPRLDDLLAQSSPELEAAPTTADDVGFWMYSSGTTGQPKGIVHAQTDPVYTAVLFGQGIVGVNENDVVFSAAKLFFAYGMGNAMNFPFYAGATTVLTADRPSAASVEAMLNRHRPTVFYGVPTLYAMLLAKQDLDLSACRETLRICVSAGEALPRDIGLTWQARVGVDILDGIGSTEMLQTFLSNRVDDNRYGTTGKPVPGYDIKLVDDEGRPVAPGEVGELLVKGPSMAIGYWNQRDKSRATFLGPWFKSGDKFIRDADGYFTYAGRADDMLKVGGIWVSPFEVESTLVSHQAVLEAAVIGKPDHDDMVKPKAYVVLNAGYVACETLEAELKEHVKTTLARYKYPRWIEFVDDLPKTATGKIQRFKLRP